MDQIKDMLMSKEPVFMSCPLWLRAVSWLASHLSNILHHFLSCHFKVSLLGSSLPYPMSQALFFGPFYPCLLEVSSSLLSSDNTHDFGISSPDPLVNFHQSCRCTHSLKYLHLHDYWLFQT